MTLVKFKKNNGSLSPAAFSHPFHGLLDNFINDTFFTKDWDSYVPAINVAEDEKEFSIEVSAPGFNKDDIKVKVEKGRLLIEGEHKSQSEKETKTYSRREFTQGSFSRSFTLPETVLPDDISAKYENGILHIVVPKKDESPKLNAIEIAIS